jgi:predicted membrane-bound spermidine synthase
MNSGLSGWSRVYSGVALTSLATLLFELSLTRIFSVVFYYHFAFLAISIALFGLGAGGVVSYVLPASTDRPFANLARLSILNSLLVILALAVVLLQKPGAGPWSLALVYFTTALPFCGAGVILSSAIAETIERVDRVYFCDLLGAAGGCLLLVPFLNYFGGPGTILAAAALFALAGAIWRYPNESAARRLSIGWAAALLAGLLLNGSYHFVDIRYAKGMELKNEIFVKWNSFSRVAIARENDNGGTIVIDADASTGIAALDIDKYSKADQKKIAARDGPGLAYALRPAAKTLVIGPGGGWDVLRSLATGSRDITGVEINPIIANTIMREKFPGMSYNLYRRPEVHIVVEDGRSFVRRSKAKYDVIQATLVDTWAATAAGAFALSENNLYTTDAFRDYLRHLSPDGILSFSRWGFEPPRESLRLVSLVIEALLQMGESRPWQHVIVAREGDTTVGALDTILVGRKPFLRADIEVAESTMTAAGMAITYLPDRRIRNDFTRLLRSSDPEQFEADYPFDISPVNDDRPFFFYTVQPRDLWDYLVNASTVPIDYKINRAVPLLFGMMAVSLLATAIILALPPVLLGARLPGRKGVRVFLLYFLLIGAGYILVEVALIQRFVLFLGHPTYALTVVIFSLLISSGTGSYWSRRAIGNDRRRWMKALGLIALLVAALALVVSFTLSAAVGLPLWLKMAITVLLIAPAGFVMGMAFPTGLDQLERWHKPSVRWAWSINAASSVLGSVGALVSAIYAGLLDTMLLGALFYVGALLVVTRRPSK